MSYQVRHVAVIGAGVMGGGIAAHAANAGLRCTLLDIVPNKLSPEEEAKGLTLESPQVRNRIVNSGYQAILKSKPPALFSKSRAELIRAGNLEDNLEWLKDADLIIEVVLENLNVKRSLFEKIRPFVKDTAIIGSNTSGLPIKDIAAGFDPDLRKRFLGTHFFNPPRWLKLLEIIPTDDTDPEVVDYMLRFGEFLLGKGVVVCKDSPNFIANRLLAYDGTFIINYAIENDYSVEEVDAITGPLMGRPKTATFKLMDLVGLDVNKHVVENLYPAIPNDEDREIFRSEKTGKLMSAMVESGRLGRKAKAGFYKMKKGEGGKKEFDVVDLGTAEYRDQQKPDLPSLKKAKGIGNLAERLRHLVQTEDKVGKMVWAVLSADLSYSSRRVPEIADTIVSIDRAIKWGFSHEMGPFEIWDALGVQETVARMEAENIKVAPWVKEMLQAGAGSFYKQEGDTLKYWDLASKSYAGVPVSPRVVNLASLKERGQLIKKNPSASLVDMGDGVACLEFHSKMNAIDNYIVDMANFAVEEVERNFKGLVIGNHGQNFCVGANIFLMLMAAKQKQWEALHKGVSDLQNTLMSLRKCARPVVVAPFGMALGGGAEISMAGDRICAAGDLFMGLVEVGVGLIPAGGGCKEMVRRVVSPSMAIAPDADALLFIQSVFEKVGMAKVSMSALEAQEWGFLSVADRIVMNADHILHDAKQMVINMHDLGYTPPAPQKLYAIGERGIAAVNALIWQMRQGNYITDHDVTVSKKLAYVLCGGALSAPAWVDEQYFLDLERETFVSLCGDPKTQDRMQHMLEKGKPLRN